MRILWLASLVSLLGCLAASGQTSQCGNTSVYSHASNDWGGYQYEGASCVPSVNSTVNNCQVYVSGGSSSIHVNCAVYTSSAGEPSALICSGTSTATSTGTGWITVPISGCGTLLAGTTYWLTVATDSSSLEFFNNYPGTATVYGSGAGSDTYGTWENPASSPFAEYPASLYFNLTAVPIGGGSKWKKLYRGMYGF